VVFDLKSNLPELEVALQAAKKAGGKMTNMLGNDLSYNNQTVNHENGILVTNGLVHDRIVEEFKKLD